MNFGERTRLDRARACVRDGLPSNVLGSQEQSAGFMGLPHGRRGKGRLRQGHSWKLSEIGEGMVTSNLRTSCGLKNMETITTFL